MSALTVITPQTLESYKRVNACQNLSYSLTPRNLRLGFLPPPLLSHHPIAHHQCAFLCLYIPTCLVYHMCSAVYLAHMQPTPQATGLLCRYLFHSLSLLPLLSKPRFGASVTTSHQLCCVPVVHFLCFLLISPSSFLPLTTVPHSYASSMSARLESLVSNHTHLEPAQLCNTWKPS